MDNKGMIFEQETFQIAPDKVDKIEVRAGSCVSCGVYTVNEDVHGKVITVIRDDVGE
jgi:hypothetical protein